MITLENISNTYDRFVTKYNLVQLFNHCENIQIFQAKRDTFENRVIKKIAILTPIISLSFFLFNYFYPLSSFFAIRIPNPLFYLFCAGGLTFVISYSTILTTIFGFLIEANCNFFPYKKRLNKLLNQEKEIKAEFSELFESKDIQAELLHIISYLEKNSSYLSNNFKDAFIDAFMNNKKDIVVDLLKQFNDKVISLKIQIDKEVQEDKKNAILLQEHHAYETSLHGFINPKEIEQEYELNGSSDAISPLTKKFNLKTIL